MKKIKLDNHSRIYKEEAGILNRDITSFYNIELIKLIISNLKNKKILLLGLGDSYVNSEIYKITNKVTILEGSKEIINNAPQYLQDLTIHTYFEDFYPKEKYDYIIGTHILEHVFSPNKLLKHIKKHWLTTETNMLFTVPSSNSLHRKIGVKLGLLKKTNELNDQDKELGHQRVYSYDEFLEEFRNSNLKIINSGGFMIKMVSHKQMKTYNRELLDAIFEVSLESDPKICSNIWIEASL
ncbi:methyltransferase domain-containing protein [Arcobacter sp.]|uniref:methyltransferase domain-containing protein n=1 Tax=Arcobacter sp. TaxID=1872629 RepID=UPI003C7789AB